MSSTFARPVPVFWLWFMAAGMGPVGLATVTPDSPMLLDMIMVSLFSAAAVILVTAALRRSCVTAVAGLTMAFLAMIARATVLLLLQASSHLAQLWLAPYVWLWLSAGALGLIVLTTIYGVSGGSGQCGRHSHVQGDDRPVS